MKIKLSKIMAAVTALGVTFAGFTALAAPRVYTHTNYEIDGTSGKTLKVYSVVEDVVPANAEVTYYVSSTAVQDNEGIIYIDQATAVDGRATFEFSGVAQDVLYDVDATTAKYGSNGDLSTTTFKFYDGSNYVSSADNSVVAGSTWKVEYSEDVVEDESTVKYEGVTYTGTVKGNPSEYGVFLDDANGNKVKFAAMGCLEDGTFVVTIRANAEDDTSGVSGIKGASGGVYYVDATGVEHYKSITE